MAKLLDLAHTAITGTLVVFSFGGLALFSQNFWGLVQHFKALPPPLSPEAAAAAAAVAPGPSGSAPRLA